LVEISWDEFFKQFDESKLALLYEEDSRFSKIVGRDTVEQRQHGDHNAARSNGGSLNGEKDQGSRGQSSDPSLKAREYRAEKGELHPHARAYMERRVGGGQDLR